MPIHKLVAYCCWCIIWWALIVPLGSSHLLQVAFSSQLAVPGIMGKAGRGPRLWCSLQEVHQLRRRMMTVAIFLGGYQSLPSLCLPDWAADEMQISGY